MSTEPVETLNNDLNPAEVCRRNGWGVGTHLAGDEGYGVTIIRITAVGERSILARPVSHDGKPVEAHRDYESSWVLWCRDWTEVDR